jgi:hypothetical protein
MMLLQLLPLSRPTCFLAVEQSPSMYPHSPAAAPCSAAAAPCSAAAASCSAAALEVIVLLLPVSYKGPLITNAL